MTPVSPSGPLDLSRGLHSTVPIGPGVSMPILGLGVWQIPDGRPTEDAVLGALRAGYRLIDTAALYGNERSVGAAMRASGLPREELFVTTKLWNDDQGYPAALAAFERSRSALDVAYVDLYLVHWPVRAQREESWRALVELHDQGKARAIGVSNFTIEHLESLAQRSGVIPAVDQVEFSPFLFQSELLEYCRRRGIQVEAYSPLVRGRRLEHPVLAGIASAHRKSPAQVVLRWDLQHGVVPIPKSRRIERIRENADLFDFELGPSEMTTLDHLHEGLRLAWDPSRFG
ncbi:MAG TPA: aldo/keto reductase [Thermoplasmata archaeon]|nr:aldo/keto reductase [Thermoplasmata archaeon]